MKRRVYFGLILCFALLVCTLVLTACDFGEQPAIPGDTATLEQTETEAPEQPEHVHEFGEWVVIKEPTCTEYGVKEQYCACGEKQTDAVEKLAHVEVIDPAVEATCTQSGLTEGTHCGVCGELLFMQTYVAPLEHTAVKAEPTEPTCLVDGWTGDTYCQVCTEVLVPGEPIPATGHDYSASETYVEPTCTEPGYVWGVCRCGAEMYNETDAPTGHTFGDWYVYKEATCTTSGLMHKECTRCDYFEKQRIEPSGHAYSATVIPPSCTDRGFTRHKCQNCSESYVDNYTDALGHTYSATVVQPGCGNRGYTEYTCYCGHSYADSYVDALGHDYVIVVTQPTCTSAGFTVSTCNRCAESRTYDYTDPLPHQLGEAYFVITPTCTAAGVEGKNCASCSYFEHRYIDALGHDLSETIVNPTCTEQGYTLYTCIRCYEESRDQYTEARGHAYVKEEVAATCTEQGYVKFACQWCSDEYYDTFTEPYGHSYESTVTKPTCIEQGYTTHTCARCQDSYVDTYTATVGHTITHTFVSATCTEGGYTVYTCTYCGHTYTGNPTQPKGHNFWVWTTDVQATCTQNGRESRYCTRCKLVEERVIEAPGHQFTESVKQATCTTDGYTTHSCSSCGYTYTDSYVTATGHSYTDWVVEKPATCIDVGRETRHCTKCGIGGLNVLPALGHDYVPCVVAPTCWNQGYTVYTCQNCGRSYDDNYTDKLTHIYGEWQLEKQPTCTLPGANGCYCTLCEHHKIESIPALGHDYSIVEIIQPTCTANGFTLHTCARCDESYKDSFTDTLMHDYEVTEVAPTCSEKGYTAYTCSLCGNEIIDNEVPALGHDYVATVIAPGCMTDGYTVYDCTRCEDYYHADHTYATGHVSEPIPPVEPTFETHGWIGGRRCSVCGMQLEAQTQVGMYRHIYVEYNEAAAVVDAPDKASFGTYITITATPKSGYEFVGWYIGDVLMCETPAYTFEVGIDEYTYTAKFINPHVWDGTIADSFAGGNGTQDDPYLISNGAQLAYLAYQINYGDAKNYRNKYYTLTCDIDLGGVNWDPIGCGYNAGGYSDSSRRFIGNFNGQGYTISNLRIDSSKQSFFRALGLFGYVGGAAHIDNLHISNAAINLNSDVEMGIQCGVLAGYLNNAHVNNCSVNGDIYMNATTASQDFYIGGLVGCANGNSWIRDCDFDGTIGGKFDGGDVYAGGMIGSIENVTIARCNFKGKMNVISANNGYVLIGGIIGSTGLSGLNSISDCYTSGEIRGIAFDGRVTAGGIAGVVRNTTITCCYTTCAVFVQSENNTVTAGGIVGEMIKFGSGSSTEIYHNLSLASVSATVTGEAEAQMGAIYAYKSAGNEYENFEAKTDSVDFYTSTLGWSADVWDFGAVESGGLPTLKH